MILNCFQGIKDLKDRKIEKQNLENNKKKAKNHILRNQLNSKFKIIFWTVVVWKAKDME